MPTFCFLTDRVDVRQPTSVLKGWQPVRTYDGVDFPLGLFNDLWIKKHCEEERLYCPNGLS